MTHGDASASPPLVAVLGATGFVGSALLAELSSRPWVVRAVARRRTVAPSEGVVRLSVHTADLTRSGALQPAIEGSNAIVYLLASTGGAHGWRIGEGDPHAERATVGLLCELLEIVAEHAGRGGDPTPPSVLLASSAGPPEPSNPYERLKREAEQILLAATRRGVVRGVSLRLATLAGPPSTPTAVPRGVVAAMIVRALKGQPLTVWQGGGMQRNVLDVRDAARAFVAALENVPSVEGSNWEIGSGSHLPVRQLFDTVAELVSHRTGRSRVPVVDVDPPPHATASDLRDVIIDPSPFQAATGWRTKFALEETLRDAVNAAFDSASHAATKAAGREHT